MSRPRLLRRIRWQKFTTSYWHPRNHFTAVFKNTVVYTVTIQNSRLHRPPFSWIQGSTTPIYWAYSMPNCRKNGPTWWKNRCTSTMTLNWLTPSSQIGNEPLSFHRIYQIRLHTNFFVSKRLYLRCNLPEIVFFRQIKQVGEQLGQSYRKIKKLRWEMSYTFIFSFSYWTTLVHILLLVCVCGCAFTFISFRLHH